MKFNCKFFLSLVLLITFVFPRGSYAVENAPEMRLYPSSGWIKHEEEFILDVLVDTKGQEVALVRAALTFDPTLIKVVGAERNDDILCDWPEDEQVIDNENGLVVATGFCQSGENDLYATAAAADVFVRISFLSLQEAQLTIDWDFTGRDEPLKTAILADGSPPQNLLTQKPIAGEYVISVNEPTGKDASTTPTTPETGLFDTVPGTILTVAGIFLLAFGTNLFFNPNRKYFSKSRTVVVYDEKD